MINQNTPQGGRGKRVLIIVLIAANLLLFVVGMITIPPNLQELIRKANSPAVMESASPIVTQESEPIVEQESEPVVTQESESMDTAAQMDILAPTEILVSTDLSNSTDTSVSKDMLQGSGEEDSSATWSTEERPDLGDFLWYTEDVLYNDVPVDTNPIDDLSTLTGSWKALIIYDPNDEFDSNAMEFLNINLEGTEEYVSLTLDWYQMYLINEGESIDETSMEDSVFNGKWENGGLWASGPGTIRLTHFYKQNQKQYIVGTIDTPDGIPALIALVRP